jgi:hypothetical protein
MSGGDVVRLRAVKACRYYGQRLWPGAQIEVPVSVAIAAVATGAVQFIDHADRQRCEALQGSARRAATTTD